MTDKGRPGETLQGEVRDERPERIVITTQKGEEFQPVQSVGKSRFAVLRNIYRTISTLLITTGLGIYAWQKVVPGLVVKTAGSMPFQVPDWLFSLFFIVIQFGIVVVLALISWFLLPEVMFMPRDLRMVTRLFGAFYLTRGKWFVFFLVKPLEWADSVVDTRAFNVDFIDIVTAAAKGVPIRANATTLVKIERPDSAVSQIEDLKGALSSVFEPAMETRLGQESYEHLQANKGDISDDLLNNVNKELERLRSEGADLGIRALLFKLKDTPIDNEEVQRYFAANIGIEKRAVGRGALRKADSEYLIGVAKDLMNEDSTLKFLPALEIAIRAFETEAWQKGGALGERGFRGFSTRRNSQFEPEE